MMLGELFVVVINIGYTYRDFASGFCTGGVSYYRSYN